MRKKAYFTPAIRTGAISLAKMLAYSGGDTNNKVQIGGKDYSNYDNRSRRYRYVWDDDDEMSW